MLTKQDLDEARRGMAQPTRPTRRRRTPADDPLARVFASLDNFLADPAVTTSPATTESEPGEVNLREVVELLRAAREELGISLGELQAETGMSRGRLSRIENRMETNLTISTLDRMAEALGLQLLVRVTDAVR